MGGKLVGTESVCTAELLMHMYMSDAAAHDELARSFQSPVWQCHTICTMLVLPACTFELALCMLTGCCGLQPGVPDYRVVLTPEGQNAGYATLCGDSV